MCAIWWLKIGLWREAFTCLTFFFYLLWHECTWKMVKLNFSQSTVSKEI